MFDPPLIYFFLLYSACFVQLCSVLAAVWPLASGLAANFIWTGECVFSWERNTTRDTYACTTHTHNVFRERQRQSFQSSGVTAECAIAHLMLFSSVLLGTVLPTAQAQNGSTNTAVYVLVLSDDFFLLERLLLKHYFYSAFFCTGSVRKDN